MEQSKFYKEAVETIKALETQLSLCDGYTSIWEHSLAEAEKQIDEYFEKMVNALAARKAALEREIALQNDTRKAVLENQRKRLEAATEGCKTTMKGAAVLHSVNPSAVEAILKGIKNTSVPTIEESKLVVELSPTLVDVIKDIGKVQACDNSKRNIVSTEGHKESDAKKWNIVQIKSPIGICFNIHDNCFYVCGKDGLYKMTLQGDISTFAVCANTFFDTIIYNSLERSFYVTSCYQNTISKVSPNGEISIFAGTAHTSGNKDAIGPKASFDSPFGLAFDKQTGNLYVSDKESDRIRKVTAKGEVTTIVGSFFGSPVNHPRGMCFDEQDNSLIVCDYGNDKLLRVKLDGKVSILCSVNGPYSVAMKGEDIYVASTTINSFRQLFRVSRAQGSAWTITPVAQLKIPLYRFNIDPIMIAIHESSCFVSDYRNDKIYKIQI